MRKTAFVVIACALALAAPAPARAAEGPDLARAPEAGVKVSLHGLFQTVGLFRSDSDFDGTERYYDRDGQSEGQIATFLRPDLRIDALRALTVFYQLELGWNVWGHNNPDQWFPGSEAYPVLKHREIWAEWRFSPQVRLRTGYQRFADPSDLFLSHWGGAVRLELGWMAWHGLTTILVGQLPDDTFEGVDVRENNFVRDNFFVGVDTQYAVCRTFKIDAAAYFVGDFRAVDRPLYLATGVVGARLLQRNYQAWVHLLGQAGSLQGAALGGGDETILAWALQFGARHQIGALHWRFNGFVLSADDDHDGNDRLGAFFASGKNRSASILLTEDENRDRYDNLDERLSSTWGSFFVSRAGLFVADAQVGYKVAPWFRPALTLAAGLTLNPENALGGRFIGLEAALALHFPLAEGVELFTVGQLFVPGEAAAAFVNDVDRSATDLVGGAEAGFVARF